MVDEHGLEVEGGADRLADLAERLELADRARQVLGARLQGLEQPDVLDGDHRLIGERLEELDLLVGEQARSARPTASARWAPPGGASGRRGDSGSHIVVSSPLNE